MTLVETLRAALRDGVYVVEFEKSDGTIRQMVCTTKHDLVAEANGRDYTPGPLDDSRRKNEDLVTAYDLDNLGWRSFYAAKVKSFEPFMENGEHVTETL